MASSQIQDICPVDIYFDVSNVYEGMKKNFRLFLTPIEERCIVNNRIAFGSKNCDTIKEWEEQFQKYGYQIRSQCCNSTLSESFVDDSLAAHIYRGIIFYKNFGKKIRFIIVSGDGNQRNSTNVGIYDAIYLAILNGIHITLWGWSMITSQKYRDLEKQYPNFFVINYLDAIRPKEFVPEKKISLPSLSQEPIPPSVKELLTQKAEQIQTLSEQLEQSVDLITPKEEDNTTSIVEPIFEKKKIPTEVSGSTKFYSHSIRFLFMGINPFPKATGIENKRLFNSRLGINGLFYSSSPILGHPHLVYAYFRNEESRNKNFDIISSKEKQVIVGGDVYKFIIDKCDTKKLKCYTEDLVFNVLVKLKVIAKDRQPIPERTKEQNTVLFANLFPGIEGVLFSKTPVKKTPHLLYAYFNTKEEAIKAIEIGNANPILEIEGVIREFNFELVIDADNYNLGKISLNKLNSFWAFCVFFFCLNYSISPSYFTTFWIITINIYKGD